MFAYYKGSGGVPIAGFWRRLLFSFMFRDINLLVTRTSSTTARSCSGAISSTRISYIAPFLHLDRDPYPVLHDGHIVWIVDGYTVSDHFPYSQRNADGINYIRNSVKVVVDAYSGKTDFYVSDPDDPMIQTWEKNFSRPVQTAGRDAAGSARAYPLSGGLVPDPGRHLPHLSYDRPAGVL